MRCVQWVVRSIVLGAALTAAPLAAAQPKGAVAKAAPKSAVASTQPKARATKALPKGAVAKVAPKAAVAPAQPKAAVASAAPKTAAPASKEGESSGMTGLPVEPPKAPLPEPPKAPLPEPPKAPAPAAPPVKTVPQPQSKAIAAGPVAAPVDRNAARRSAMIKGGAALTGIGIGLGMGTAIAAALVGSDAGGLRNTIARAGGGESACSGRLASVGRSCAELVDLTNRQSVLSNVAVWSFVGAAGVGLATVAYAFGTHDKALPAKGMIVAPVVGEATGGLSVTGLW